MVPWEQEWIALHTWKEVEIGNFSIVAFKEAC